MTTEFSNAKLRRAVLASLVSEPRVETRFIGVSVDAGVVTLSGRVTSNVQKDAANAAGRRVRGVGAVTDTVGVALPCPDVENAGGKDPGARPILTIWDIQHSAVGAFARPTREPSWQGE